jgi:hypothetical protein
MRKIIKRFASVFGQTYRRYLDLQKAEAQAREAKIEAALEKVRSRSLAMHKSQEIQEVINEVFIRLRELEINLDSANILIFENVRRTLFAGQEVRPAIQQALYCVMRISIF